MNKYYPIKQIKSAWLTEVSSDRSLNGIKNILGIVVTYNSENLFYSILDDCFFRIIPFSTFPSKYNSAQEQINYYLKYSDQVFAEINDNNLPVWLILYDKFKKDFLTKEELIASRDILPGHYSDLDYNLETETSLDYKNKSIISENIISSETEYRKKKGRPITYNPRHIYGPNAIKKKKL